MARVPEECGFSVHSLQHNVVGGPSEGKSLGRRNDLARQCMQATVGAGALGQMSVNSLIGISLIENEQARWGGVVGM